MTQFALAAQIRNALLVSLATLTLAACGSGSDAGTAAATSVDSDAATASVLPNAGMIDRSQGIDQNDSTTSVGTVASNTNPTAPITATTTPASGSSSSSGTTTVNTGSKTTTPVTVAVTDGVTTVDWMPPTPNTDGSALTNLAGYTVYYGTSPNDLSKSMKVSNPGLASFTVTGLTSGKWYFAVTSYAADGTESTRTATVSTSI
jgi:hypothetical protein